MPPEAALDLFKAPPKFNGRQLHPWALDRRNLWIQIIRAVNAPSAASPPSVPSASRLPLPASRLDWPDTDALRVFLMQISDDEIEVMATDPLIAFRAFRKWLRTLPGSAGGAIDRIAETIFNDEQRATVEILPQPGDPPPKAG